MNINASAAGVEAGKFINVNSEVKAAKASSVQAPDALIRVAEVTEPKKAIDPVTMDDVVVSEVSKQGDQLDVSEMGIDSAMAGGTVATKSDDGVVAKRDEITVKTNAEALDKLKEQINEARESQAKHMADTINTFNKQAEMTAGRAEVLIEQFENQAADRMETAKNQVGSLMGMSESEVNRLYREGKVSRQDYEQNMNRREELKADNNEAAREDSELVKQVVSNDAAMTQNKALVESVENGKQDIMQAAIDMTKLN